MPLIVTPAQPTMRLLLTCAIEWAHRCHGLYLCCFCPGQLSNHQLKPLLQDAVTREQVVPARNSTNGCDAVCWRIGAIRKASSCRGIVLASSRSGSACCHDGADRRAAGGGTCILRGCVCCALHSGSEARVATGSCAQVWKAHFKAPGFHRQRSAPRQASGG